jgi:hypothetical protein
MPTGRRVPHGAQLGRNTLNAYAAGLLDGEGCIRWNKSPSVEVTNKDFIVLMIMQHKWGGTIREKQENVYVWTLYGRKALDYLLCVARYSVIKHKQIVALFAAWKSRGNKRDHYIRTLKRLKHEYSH